MTDLILLHNPRCSKSRQALELLQQRGVALTVRNYLEQPLSSEELAKLLSLYDGDGMDLVRKGEAEFATSGLHANSDTAAIIAALSICPRLLQRPVLYNSERAVIGRPPEQVLQLPRCALSPD